MIYLYTGVPGSGKSYHMAVAVYRAYKEGKNIFCNFEVNLDYLKKKFPRSKAQVFILDSRDLLYPLGLIGYSLNYCKRDENGRVEEGQSYLFVDECNKYFDSRTWNQTGRADWNDFFSEHRKYGFDVVLTTQCINDVDKKLRGRIEFEIKHFDAKHFTLFGKFLAFLSGGHLFIQRSQWITKGNYKANKIGSSFVRGKKRYYKVFNTSELFMKVSNIRPVWRAVGN